MASIRRILSSQLNGKRSRGPKTGPGKLRSSQNAVRHGLLAKCVLLSNESQPGFEMLLSQYVDRLNPQDGVELGMVEEMTAAWWRVRRAWAIENELMEAEVARQPGEDDVTRIAQAFRTLSSTPELNLIQRYETRLHRIYQRSLHNLLFLRAATSPNEPAPISEHPIAMETQIAQATPDDAPTPYQTNPVPFPDTRAAGDGEQAEPTQPREASPEVVPGTKRKRKTEPHQAQAMSQDHVAGAQTPSPSLSPPAPDIPAGGVRREEIP
jgi:hypothetical protein